MCPEESILKGEHIFLMACLYKNIIHIKMCHVLDYHISFSTSLNTVSLTEGRFHIRRFVKERNTVYTCTPMKHVIHTRNYEANAS